MKLCIDCKYYKKYIDVPNAECRRDIVLVNSPVDGQLINMNHTRFCITERKYEDTESCGIEAKYFKPKESVCTK